MGQFSDLHHKGEIIPLRGGDIQISVIVRARIHGDYHRGKAHPHELEIHDEPGRSAVPVLEEVDVHEIRMDAGREFHGMQRTPRRTVPPEKGFHLFGHALRRRRDVPCTGDKHIHPAVCPGIGTVDVAQDEVVNLLQRPFSQGLVLLDERFHVVDGVAMPYRLQVLLEALAAYGDAVLQHSLGFAHGERVPFDGIGVVGEAHAHVLPDLGNDIRGQRAVGIEARLERIQGGNSSAVSFMESLLQGLRIMRRGKEAREGFSTRPEKFYSKGPGQGSRSRSGPLKMYKKECY